MAYIKMTGEIPVVNRFHKLLEFILCFSEKTVKIRNLPGNHRNEDDEINILGLDHRYCSHTEHREHENNTDEYAKFELFKHDLKLTVGPLSPVSSRIQRAMRLTEIVLSF